MAFLFKLKFMKYLLILTLFLVSCDKTTVKTKKVDSQYNGRSIKEVEYDGCTYVVFNEGDMKSDAAWGAHKGNCPNSIHKQ